MPFSRPGTSTTYPRPDMTAWIPLSLEHEVAALTLPTNCRWQDCLIYALFPPWDLHHRCYNLIPRQDRSNKVYIYLKLRAFCIYSTKDPLNKFQTFISCLEFLWYFFNIFQKPYILPFLYFLCLFMNIFFCGINTTVCGINTIKINLC